MLKTIIILICIAIISYGCYLCFLYMRRIKREEELKKDIGYCIKDKWSCCERCVNCAPYFSICQKYHMDIDLKGYCNDWELPFTTDEDLEIDYDVFKEIEKENVYRK